MTAPQKLLVGLDIGTSKIACIVAEVTAGDKLNVIGIGTHPSNGLRKGVVVNIESTIESIRLAVQEAELMAGVEIKTVYTGIAGSHIQGHNSFGIVATKGAEVTEHDVHRVIEAARALKIPSDQKILHILPQEYIIDDQDGIHEPISMTGVRLEAKVHIVSGLVSAVQNILKCCERCNLEVADIVLEQLASSEAVLQQDERDIGVALVDIGGGTADIALYIEGAIRHTASIPIGGDHLTNDLVLGLRTSKAVADELKIKAGCCMGSMIPADQQIEVPSVGGRPPRPMPRQVMCQILEPRVEELFGLINREIKASGYHDFLAAGLVLTGGSSRLLGMIELAEDVFDIPVRLGQPQNVGGLNDVVNSPSYATGLGLVQFGHRYHGQESSTQTSVRENHNDGIWKRMRQWFGDTE